MPEEFRTVSTPARRKAAITREVKPDGEKGGARGAGPEGKAEPTGGAFGISPKQRWQQVIFCKSKSSHKSFPCKSKSSHKSFPCKSKSSHKSFGQTSSQVKSQVIWSKHKSSHKSLCPSTSQVAHYFFHSRNKKGNIIKSKRK